MGRKEGRREGKSDEEGKVVREGRKRKGGRIWGRVERRENWEKDKEEAEKSKRMERKENKQGCKYILKMNIHKKRKILNSSGLELEYQRKK